MPLYVSPFLSLRTILTITKAEKNENLWLIYVSNESVLKG